MRIALTRSGGFAGIMLHRDFDTTQLPPHRRRVIEQLAARARVERASPNAEADAFEYEITIDGAHYLVDGSSPAWHALIEALRSPDGKTSRTS